jgi:hypothetical protein
MAWGPTNEKICVGGKEKLSDAMVLEMAMALPRPPAGARGCRHRHATG